MSEPGDGAYAGWLITNAITDSPSARAVFDRWQADDQQKQPRFLIMMISATEERGVDGADWRLSLDVPAGWKLLQVLPGTPAPEGRIACVLERVDLCEHRASVSRLTR